MLHHGFDNEGPYDVPSHGNKDVDHQDEPLNPNNDNNTDEEEAPHGFEDQNSQEPEQERDSNQRQREDNILFYTISIFFKDGCAEMF